MYPAVAVANYYIKNHPGITQMKLQKLVYYAHAASLAMRGEALIQENVYAWQYGPVIKELYDDFSMYGKNPIPGNLPIDFLPNPGCNIPDSDPETQALLEVVWNKFGHLSGIQLSKLTHQEGEAWTKVASQYPSGIPHNTLINPSEITESFRQRFLKD